MADTHTDIPSWLTTPEHYRPGSDRDGFISRSLLSITSALAFFRLDDGREARFSPSAPVIIHIIINLQHQPEHSFK